MGAMDLHASERLATMVGALDGDDLSVLAGMVRDEQQRRALAAGDLDAVVGDAFDRGFDGRGMAVEPWITDEGLLVCPGSKIHRSKQSHRCRFVAVGDCWVWEAAERITDELRWLPDRSDSLQTVTVLAAVDGLVIDVVTAKASGGAHTRESAVAYEVRGGALEAVASRTAVSGHGRR
jgi:hypothetical protein